MQMRQNFELAMIQAAKIEDAGRDCCEIAAELERQIAAIAACWNGETAMDVTQSLAAWQTEISQMSIALEKLADRIASRAAVLREMDAAVDRGQSEGTSEALEDAQ